MNKYTLLAPLLLGTALSGQANHFELAVMGGLVISDLTNNESVTVHPLVTNDYDTDKDTVTGPLGGLGLSYVFDGLAHKTWAIGVGLSSYFINYGEISGTEYPFVNGGSFDTLDYRFKTNTYALMLEPKFVYTKWVVEPYAILGIGAAWNHAYNYKEVPTDPSGSAAAAPNPFGSNTVTSFAYEIGAGIQYKIATDPFYNIISVDYRYMNMGHAELGTMEGQLTNDHLEVSPLATQAIVFTWTTIF